MMLRSRFHWLLLAVVGTGCGGGSEGGSASARKDAAGRWPDAGTSADGAGVLKGDSAKVEAMPPNVFADAPVFNWEASGSGGAGGGGGVPGTGGVGGSGAGGNAMDAGAFPPDAFSVDAGLPGNADGSSDRRPDTSSDAAPRDGGPGDAATTCVASIVPVLPAVLPDGQYLVAAANMKIALRAQVLSGAPPTGAAWTWQAKWNGSPLAVAETDPHDLAAAAFLIANEGDYAFTAMAGNCVATFARAARGPGGCAPCDQGTDVQIVSPPSYALPTQSGYFGYAQSIRLAESHMVKFFTSAGNRLLQSYVRINKPDGSLVTDGYVDPSVGFSRPLLVLASNGDVARYQVLVVPLDGSGDGTSGTPAPQLFTNLTTADLEQNANLKLSGGVTVSGTIAGGGKDGGDARVMLSNQDPAVPATLNDLIFSSVGRSNAQGGYVLHAQPGQYWVTISPTTASGLAEALDPLPVTLTTNATIDFQWHAPTTAPLTLQVSDAAGQPARNTRVLVSATQLSPVGTLTFASGGGNPITHAANGNVQMQATSDALTGVVTFPALPADATYNVWLIPATPGPFAATTQLSLTVPAGGLTKAVSLAGEAYILGQLVAGVAPDWSQVQVVAFDKSQLVPEAPRAVLASADGSFALGVSPGRSYAVVVWPNPGSGLARTFVGPGLMQASGFTTTQKVQATKEWTSTVSITISNQVVGVVGAALQATCHPGYWRCIDPTIPLAETASGEGGVFTLNVPDPATR